MTPSSKKTQLANNNNWSVNLIKNYNNYNSKQNNTNSRASNLCPNKTSPRMPSPPSTPRIRNTPQFPPAPKLARAKLKSSSLDHEIFLTSTTNNSRAKHHHHRTLQTSTSVEWHQHHQQQHHSSLTIPRTGSTSSLASSTFQYSLGAGGGNYHDFKNEIINQVSKLSY